jgi:hypothetical protein
MTNIKKILFFKKKIKKVFFRKKFIIFKNITLNLRLKGYF